MSKTMIIDSNSVGYAAHHSTKLTSGGMQTQAVFGFLRTIRDIHVENAGAKVMCLWDGRAQWRFDLNPEYKSKRTEDPKKVVVKDAYEEQRPYIGVALNALGVRQLTVADREADDMAGYLVRALTVDPTHEIDLITGDQDWIQLVRPNVTWRDHRDDSRVVTLDTLMDKTGYATPLAFLEGKCLHGDTSDCISGVGGIGKDGAPPFLAEFGSVREFWRRCDSGEFVPKKKAHIKLCSAEGRMLFGRNLRLMQLLKVAPPAKNLTNMDFGKFDKDRFAQVCEELAFVSILRNLDHFVKPFIKE